MSLTNLHYLTNYQDELHQFMKQEEGLVLTPYFDAKGSTALVTIGIGFNIDTVSKYLEYVLTELGINGAVSEIDPTKTANQLIKDAMDGVANGSDNNATLRSTLNDVLRSNFPSLYGQAGTIKPNGTFELTETQAYNVLDKIVADKVTKLDGWLTEYNIDVASLKGTKEYMALTSLFYNREIVARTDSNGNIIRDAQGRMIPNSSSLIGVNLLTDLANNNRLAAWYEISYHTNGDGIHANRRYQEAALFGLWDAGGPTQTELQNFETFLSSNDPYSTISVLQNMRNYEAKYPPSAAGIGTIDDEINDNITIKNHFVNKYAPGAPIDGNVILGTELNNKIISDTRTLTLTEIKSGYLKSTDRNDLILGGGGSDTIYGGGGADVIYGEAGNDTIYGGTGSDIMIGGQGNDTYIIDGNDRIIDSDDKGIVRDKNGQEIAGIFIKQADGTYQWTNNTQVTATKNSPLTLYLPDGSSVVIENQVNNGDFGIHLLDTPTEPQITNTIVGDLAPMDIDPITAGIQTGYDALGNLITGPNSEPNRADYFYDSAGNDRIEGRGGNDVINADKGGNDYLDGGLGDDLIQAGDGSDMLYGVGSIML